MCVDGKSPSSVNDYYFNGGISASKTKRTKAIGKTSKYKVCRDQSNENHGDHSNFNRSIVVLKAYSEMSTKTDFDFHLVYCKC